MQRFLFGAIALLCMTLSCRVTIFIRTNTMAYYNVNSCLSYYWDESKKIKRIFRQNVLRSLDFWLWAKDVSRWKDIPVFIEPKDDVYGSGEKYVLFLTGHNKS